MSGATASPVPVAATIIVRPDLTFVILPNVVRSMFLERSGKSRESACRIQRLRRLGSAPRIFSAHSCSGVPGFSRTLGGTSGMGNISTLARSIDRVIRPDGCGLHPDLARSRSLSTSSCSTMKEVSADGAMGLIGGDDGRAPLGVCGAARGGRVDSVPSMSARVSGGSSSVSAAISPLRISIRDLFSVILPAAALSRVSRFVCAVYFFFPPPSLGINLTAIISGYHARFGFDSILT